MARSVTTRSKRSAAKRAIASAPSPSATTLCPADSRMSPITSRTGGSSSTTRQRSERTAGVSTGTIAGVGAAASAGAGSDRRKVEPWPASLSTVIEPPCREMMP